MFEQQGVWANCKEASFSSGDLQQDSTFETTETSTRLTPQKYFSILKEYIKSFYSAGNNIIF